LPGASSDSIAATCRTAAHPGAFRHLARLLTSRRITLHAALLAVCLWSLYAADLAIPGLRDRVGQIKGADFLHFYTAGYLVRTRLLQPLYDPAALAAFQKALVPQSTGTYFVASYGPQVYLPFSVLARLPYAGAALAWALLNCVLYLACCYAVWFWCPRLRPHALIVFLLALAFPGFFNLIAFGQTSGPALALFTLAFLALRSRRHFLAGLAIGSLIYKPQLGLAAAVIFLVAAEWKVLAGALVAAAAQLSFAWAWFGTAVMQQYLRSLLRTSQALPFIEPKLYQLHCLRGFWLLLLPWRNLAAVLYVLSAAVILVIAVVCWRSRATLSLRFAALLLATVLVAPHLMVYDLVILAPAFLLLGEWAMQHAQADALRLFLYLAFALPLLAPLAKFTHVQLSVISLVALQALVWLAVQHEPSDNHNSSQAAEA
jgi:alpha-1,2-mannosyltransferase